VPEGNAVHRLAGELRRDLGGQVLAVSSPQGRFAAGAARLDGQVLEDVEAWGKHLFLRFSKDDTLHVHLGLYGKFWPADPLTHRQVRLRMVGEDLGLDLTGPTACDLVADEEVDRILARLGPDPIRRGANPERAWARVRRSPTPIGKVLMDQSVFAGVGNIYRAEVLYVHGVHPELPSRELAREQFDAMWAWLVKAMRRGVKQGRIVTAGRHGRHVYKVDECRECGTPVRRWDMAGRWAYACETCQPRA
jgi:endonuclease-8